MESPPRALEQMLSPTGVRNFFERYWERAPLHLPGSPGQFRSLFSESSFSLALLRLPHEPEASMRASYVDSRGKRQEFIPAPDEVLHLVAAGMNIRVEKLERLDRRLAGFIQELHHDLRIPGRIEIEANLSPPGRGASLHLNDHSQWTLQIEGSKRWRYGAAPTPPFAIGALDRVPPGGLPGVPSGDLPPPSGLQLQETILHPGAFLYLPQSTWHETEAVDRSLSLTVRIPWITPLDLIQEAIRPLLYQSQEWRSALPVLRAENTEAGGRPEGLSEVLATRLRELRTFVDTLDPDALLRVWDQRVAQDERSSGTNRP